MKDNLNVLVLLSKSTPIFISPDSLNDYVFVYSILGIVPYQFKINGDNLVSEQFNNHFQSCLSAGLINSIRHHIQVLNHDPDYLKVAHWYQINYFGRHVLSKNAHLVEKTLNAFNAAYYSVYSIFTNHFPEEIREASKLILNGNFKDNKIVKEIFDIKDEVLFSVASLPF